MSNDTYYRSQERRIQDFVERDGLTQLTTSIFQQLILSYYHSCDREFAWRQTDDPYHILVSEIMLQQTQTLRVLKNHESFLSTFPNIKTLAESPLIDVLQAWQGIGNNRRAVALHKIDQVIVADYKRELLSL